MSNSFLNSASSNVSRKKNWVKFVKVMTSLIFFPNGKLRFRLDLFDRAYFSGLRKSSLSRDYIKNKLFNKERNKLDFNNN
jgi:hypothetical protein